MNDGVNKYTHVDCPGHEDYLKNTHVLVVGGKNISPSVTSALRTVNMNVAVLIANDVMSLQNTGKDIMVLERSLDSDLVPQISLRPKNKPYYRQLSGGKKRTNKSW